MQGTNREPRLREFVTWRGGGDGARHAEISDQRVTFREHDVLGFDVAMDNALPVGVVECIRDFAGNTECITIGSCFSRSNRWRRVSPVT